MCSVCKNEITSSNDLKSCGTAGFLYKICSRSECHHFLENKYYCNNCFTVNKSIHNDTYKRLFRGSNNDEYVTVFRNNEGDKDIHSVALTLRSMSDNTLFGRLPDWVVSDPEPLDSVMRPIDCLTLPTQSDYNNDDDESIVSNISDDCSDIIPVDENIKQYLMKGGICIL